MTDEKNNYLIVRKTDRPVIIKCIAKIIGSRRLTRLIEMYTPRTYVDSVVYIVLLFRRILITGGEGGEAKKYPI